MGPDSVALEKSMGFKYYQCIRELMFAAVTCQPDILFSTTYLSQYSDQPVACYYIAVKCIFYYLRSTITDRIYYWYTTRNPSLPFLPLPQMNNDTYSFDLPFGNAFKSDIFANSD